MRVGLPGFNVVQRMGQAKFQSAYVPNGHAYAGSNPTNATGIHVRDGAKLHRLNGKWWLLGGWWLVGLPEWNGSLTTNQVWSSPDLATWTLELPHDENPPTSGPGARWRKRHNFGSCVMNGYIWVVGGDHLDTIYPPTDIWRSRDGITWERVAESSIWGPRRLPIVGVFRNEIHMLGGESMGANFPSASDHWSSPDGINWKKLPDMPVRRAGVTCSASLSDKLVLVGGDDGDSVTRTFRNDTWAYNGKVWVQQSASAPWPGRLWNGVLAYDQKLWLCAGRIADEIDIADCWYSEDLGVTWKSFPAPWPATHADGVDATEEDGIALASAMA